MSLLRDVRLWWEDRGWGADERRCLKVLALTEGRLAPRPVILDTRRVAGDRLRSGAAWIEAYALQLDEIRGLPEIEPFDRWTP